MTTNQAYSMMKQNCYETEGQKCVILDQKAVVSGIVIIKHAN